MARGDSGLFLGLTVPVLRDNDVLKSVTCSKLFAYEADIHGVDVIIWYPFLKAFHFVVDSLHDRLVLGKRGSAFVNRVGQADSHCKKLRCPVGTLPVPIPEALPAGHASQPVAAPASDNDISDWKSCSSNQKR